MSSLSKLDKLMYSIGVIDKVTGPVNKIMSKINQLSEQTAAAKEQMMGGLMSAAGGAMMLVGSLNPAIEAQAAMGEVSSLNVSNEALTQLNNTALNFVSNYGGNSADIIRSSYDIQSAIAGLTGKELSAFTNSSAILAKGTKSDAATTTDYFGTMYGIYQDTAKEVGKSEWINMLTGQTAASVRMFKTTGSEMAGAFSSLGAAANSHGIEMNESMAVMGQLQATMSGSEAGTKYKAFLTGVGSAQQKLGIQLTDSQGKLLPMVQVIERLKGRFGEIDTVAKSDALKNAFGSDEAVAMLKLLMPQTEQLKGNISALANITDMGVAVEMADAMNTSWSKFGGSLNAALTSLGQAVLPIIEPVVDVLSSLLQTVVWLSQAFPTLTGIIAAAIVAFTGYIVIMGAFNAVMGLYRMAMLSGIALTNAHLLITRLWQGALVALRVAGFVALIASMGTAALAMGAFKTVMLAGQAATWLFNAALWANPITWIVAGVIALIAAVAALVYYFDDITAAFNDWADSSMIFQGLRVAFDLLTLPLQLMWWLIKTIASGIYNLLSPAISAIGSVFTFLWNTVSSISSAISGFFADIAQGVIGFFSSLWDGAGGLVEQFVAYISDKFSFVTQFFSGVSNSIGGIFERITGFLKRIADNGVLNMVVSFFTGDDIAVKAKAEQLESIQTKSKPNNFVMQNADNAFSREYGQTVINKAAQLPGDSVTSNYAAVSDDVNNSLINKTVSSTRDTDLRNAIESNVTTLAVNQVTANMVANSIFEKSLSNTALQAATQVTANSALNSVIEKSVSNVATQAANPITAINNYAAANEAINTTVSSTAKNDYVGQGDQIIKLATQSAPKSIVVNPTNNFTNAANSPVFDSLSVQLASLNQAESPLQTLPTTKTDQVITNAVNTSAYKVDQLSNEQEQQSNSYKAKVQKSSFLQNLTRNTSYTDSRSDSDNRKSVHIDSLTIKSDDPAQSFEQLMELAG
ncbi:phage tail tape measure protein [Pseudoalteromonas shioyasakiensis]|uniref:phage tail tape measure protein n=1 Tax=Pseudoalteromonas shioyasakiensis TaxID=1190813 RepID=UPI00211911A3|nr:phage tail tape measure protein [Pseudoalteromonas shioyasakiensis]MCQ8882737.1 phage tail tape measure protein [Pseudoalteromonas shioyasakiensis]